uniref:Uncharacterized protein n=1 Tax=Sphaerodactylus townsendi TaxID=933632 RepID=A0ACB8FN20_9SAUR
MAVARAKPRQRTAAAAELSACAPQPSRVPQVPPSQQRDPLHGLGGGLCATETGRSWDSADGSRPAASLPILSQPLRAPGRASPFEPPLSRLAGPLRCQAVTYNTPEDPVATKSVFQKKNGACGVSGLSLCHILI